MIFGPSGQRVQWTYTHYLNSKSCTRITKKGTIHSQCRDRHGLMVADFVWVIFDGNKGKSKVKLSELREMDQSRL